jgi:septal ring factor EnvC (AmiA/AmiB activator)
VNTGIWEKTRNVIALALLVVISYAMGLGHARSEKSAGEYSALKAEYDRTEKEYTALKAQYERTETQYAALKAQYERVENGKVHLVVTEPKDKPYPPEGHAFASRYC